MFTGLVISLSLIFVLMILGFALSLRSTLSINGKIKDIKELSFIHWNRIRDSEKSIEKLKSSMINSTKEIDDLKARIEDLESSCNED